MTGIADPLLLAALETVALAERRLAEAVDRLEVLAPTVAGLADDTGWATEAAVRFHVAAGTWQADVRSLTALTAAARDDVRRLGDRLGMLVWGQVG